MKTIVLVLLTLTLCGLSHAADSVEKQWFGSVDGIFTKGEFIDLNSNLTLGAALLGGGRDPWGISDVSRFSTAYNDWGIGQGKIDQPQSLQLGLGGDINGRFYKGPVTDNNITSPTQMIMLGDAKDDASWDGSLDPTEADQWPSNRHSRRTNLQFVDGHGESPVRGKVIDPASSNEWRTRWNSDNQPHNEITWSVDWTLESVLEH